MNRILVFHEHETVGNEKRMAPSGYYMDVPYSPVVVRICAETAPTSDAEFDIFDDGVSIFSNRNSDQINISTGVRTVATPLTTAVLGDGESTTEVAGNFNDTSIDAGSWITCNIVKGGGGKNFTVQLELEPLNE